MLFDLRRYMPRVKPMIPTDCPFTWTTDHWHCPQCGFDYKPRHPGPRKPPRRNCPKAPDAPPRRLGTGDYLHAILKKWFHADYSWGCGCESMVRQMNEWGPAGCREHIDEIADKMVAEAVKRGWRLARLRMPTRTVAKMLIRLAIRRAERTTPEPTPPPPTMPGQPSEPT